MGVSPESILPRAALGALALRVPKLPVLLRLLLKRLAASAPVPLSLERDRNMGGGELKSRVDPWLLPESMSMPVGDSSRLRLRRGVRGNRSARGDVGATMSASRVPSEVGERVAVVATKSFSQIAGSEMPQRPLAAPAIFCRRRTLRRTSRAASMTIKAPVRPTPAEQWTTIGPAV